VYVGETTASPTPTAINAEFILFDGVRARADRPYEYFPKETDSPEDIALELESSAKYFAGNRK
jgi:hypothetical protein